MKKINLVIAVVLLLVSCRKTDITLPAPELVVEASAMADFQVGKTVKFFNVNNTATPVTPVNEGKNQTWDFSNLSESDTTSIRFLQPIANDSFPTATYMQAVTELYGIGNSTVASNSKYYGELSSSGFASLGKTIQQVSFNLTGGSIVLPAQSIRSSQKIYSAKFPMKYGDSSANSGIVEIYKMLVSAPPFIPANSPGKEVSLIDYTIKVMASGTVKLRGYTTPLPVLVLRNFTSTKVNYFVNGGPAPAPLLAAAGVTDGSVYTSYYYSFYSPTIGFVGSIYMNSTNTAVMGASFRRYF
jgi:hypothetical protein